MDRSFMQRALYLAKLGEFSVSPNPMVGCVIVKENTIIGEGWHEKPGGPHAEIMALNNITECTKGATMYVTLEPCCHYNRTPPCTNRIIDSEVSKVIIPCLDPNPKVSGKGVQALQEAGIVVVIGLLKEEAEEINKIFFHYQKSKIPYVTLKWAMSLDGKTIVNPEDCREISCPESSNKVHKSRARMDAILIGANTARKDNPLLTARSEVTYKNPIRIVLSTDLNLPKSLRIFKEQDVAKTIIATIENNKDKYKEFLDLGIEVIHINPTEDHKVDIKDLLFKLGQREITSIFVEGGREVHNSFFASGFVNSIQVYIAPYIIADLPKKLSLEELHIEKIDRDILISSSLQ